jgi:hypothetical protein
MERMIYMAYESYKIKKGNDFNRPTFELEFTTSDTGVTPTTIGNYMANNYSNYDEENIGYIPQGTIACLTTGDMMFVAKFIERSGIQNPNNGWYEGTWFCLANVARVQ